jgi:hypothetical protein
MVLEMGCTVLQVVQMVLQMMLEMVLMVVQPYPQIGCR